MTPVGVFFICQNEDKCHFVNSTKVNRILERFETFGCIHKSGGRILSNMSK